MSYTGPHARTVCGGTQTPHAAADSLRACKAACTADLDCKALQFHDGATTECVTCSAPPAAYGTADTGVSFDAYLKVAGIPGA